MTNENWKAMAMPIRLRPRPKGHNTHTVTPKATLAIFSKNPEKDLKRLSFVRV